MDLTRLFKISRVGRLDFHVRMAVLLSCAIGYAVLFISGVYSFALIPVVLMLLALGYINFYQEKSPFFPDNVWTILTLAIVIVPIALSFTGRLFFLDALDFIFLFLPLIKLVTAKSGRDYLQIYALAFGQILYGTIVNLDISFGIALAAYLSITMWGLVVLGFKTTILKSEGQEHLVGEAEKVLFKKSYLAFVALLPVSAIIITSFLFFIIPRPGSALASFAFGVGKKKSGFSDQVHIGEMGEIKLDNSIAMRVVVSGQPLEKPIYWKGAVLDSFNGMDWSMNTELPPNRLSSVRRNFFQVTSEEMFNLSKQSIFLDGVMTRYIFHANFPGWINVRSHMLDIYANSSVALPERRAFVQHYEVWSSTKETIVLPEDVLPYFLQLPDNLDPRVITLAREITRDADTPLKAALLLENYLQTQFDYSLNSGIEPSANPLSKFLFERKAGHCEYFATAMTVMLRTLGIHSRLVTGYQQGEYNESEGYYLVRQSDAHAWVETYINGKWIRFDPTPAAGWSDYSQSVINDIQKLLDSLAFKWQRYVIAYNVKDQIEFLLETDAKMRMTSVAEVKLWLKKHTEDFAVIVLFMMAIVLYVKRKDLSEWLRQRKVKTKQRHELSIYFKTIKKMLEKSGLEINEAMTAREIIAEAKLKFPDAHNVLDNWLLYFEPLRYRPGEINSNDVNTLKKYEAEIKELLTKK